MRPGERRFRSEDGREWTVTLEGPRIGLSGPDAVENTGGMLPEESPRIVFRSGGEALGEEYTGLTAVEDLSEDDLQRWLDAAKKGEGL